MMPMSPQPDVVERRLALQRQLLRQLRGLLPLDEARLGREPLTRAAVERMIQAVVDLALDVNAHIASSVLGRAPATGRDSFDLMVEAGVFDEALATRLKPAVGLRNFLVHLYADIDLAIVADSAEVFCGAFEAYVRATARWLVGQN